jgi:hypothetical protein
MAALETEAIKKLRAVIDAIDPAGGDPFAATGRLTAPEEASNRTVMLLAARRRSDPGNNKRRVVRVAVVVVSRLKSEDADTSAMDDAYEDTKAVYDALNNPATFQDPALGFEQCERVEDVRFFADPSGDPGKAAGAIFAVDVSWYRSDETT